jgi:hypothetical protein
LSTLWELIAGNAYRVTSEEEAMTLLNMVVCSLCGMEAKRLELHEALHDLDEKCFNIGCGCQNTHSLRGIDIHGTWK